MSTENRKLVLLDNLQKCRKSIALLEASINKINPFDEKRVYTSDELEPYDALSDRFIRAVEIVFKFLRSYQIYNEGISAETLRDLLLFSEKTGMVSSVDIWLEMREIRNRIVHNYQPDMQKHLIEDIIGPFFTEIRQFKEKLNGFKTG